MQKELFQHHWARPCPKYDGAVIWCINEARKTSKPFHGRINRVSRRSPDCQQVARREQLPLSLTTLADRPGTALGHC